MKEKKLVVFDMDGTLNRIELFIIPTYKEVLPKFAGAQADDDTVMRLMGCGLATMRGSAERNPETSVQFS